MANGHGGKREGAGRPKGGVSERVADMLDHLSEDKNNPILMLTEVAQKARKAKDWQLLYKVANSLAGYYVPKVKPLEDGQEDAHRDIHVSVNFPLPGDHWRTGKPVPQEIDDYLDGDDLVPPDTFLNKYKT